MSDAKVQSTHLRRPAVVYVRQSTAAQVEHHRESTRRQYDLTERARQLGWRPDQITVIDEDLGLSGATTQGRSGFARMTAQVALGQVGILLGLEVSRLARNNADWYRLLDLCGMTDTLIGDADGVYHPNVFNDRLVLGLKGTFSEVELHVLRARLDGGIRNKAARGELRRGLPVGLVWGERDGEIRLHPDEAVTGAIRAVFERFAEFGSVRRVWLWFVSEKLTFPLRLNHGAAIRWVPPSYHAIHQVLTNPAYAGAYTYGKSRQQRVVDDNGVVCIRVRAGAALGSGRCWITEHHPGYIDWPTYEDNLVRIAGNTRPRPHAAGSGAVREGSALLQGIGHVRPLRTAAVYPLPGTKRLARLSLPREEHRAGKRRVLPEHRRRTGRPGGFPRPCSTPCGQPVWGPRWAPPNKSKPITTAHSNSGVWPSNGRATKPSAPNAVIALSSPRIGSSRGAWRRNGNSA